MSLLKQVSSILALYPDNCCNLVTPSHFLFFYEVQNILDLICEIVITFFCECLVRMSGNLTQAEVKLFRYLKRMACKLVTGTSTCKHVLFQKVGK